MPLSLEGWTHKSLVLRAQVYKPLRFESLFAKPVAPGSSMLATPRRPDWPICDLHLNRAKDPQPAVGDTLSNAYPSQSCFSVSFLKMETLIIIRLLPLVGSWQA